MKTATLLAVTLCAAATAYADFSYTTTRKSQGSPAAGAAPSATKYYFKGQKMATDSGDIATVVDFDAQTISTIHKAQKTYSVMKFSDLGQVLKQADVDAKVDLKETGQKKVINGFNATQTIVTMEVDSPMNQSGMKMQMEIDMWRSSDVPGAQELKAFFQKNASNLPWAAMSGGGAATGMQKAMADVQRKMSTTGGVTLLQTVRTKAAGSAAQTAQMQAGMAQMRAQMEAMAKQGGPQAAAAQQALARMGAASGGGSLFEITMESSDFSTGSVPDSVFVIPAGFQKVERK
jgi:hypothetical protein